MTNTMELVASLFQQNQELVTDRGAATSHSGTEESKPGSAGSSRPSSPEPGSVGGRDIECGNSVGTTDVISSDNKTPYVSSQSGSTQPYDNGYNQQNTQSPNFNIDGNVGHTPEVGSARAEIVARTVDVYDHNRSNSAETSNIRICQQHRTHLMPVVTPTKSQTTDDTFTKSPIISPANSTDSRPSSSPKRTRKKLIRFASTNEVRTYTPNPDEFSDHPTNIIKMLHNTRGSRMRHFLTVRALPFTYGAISSINTIYFFLEMMVRYGLNRQVIGAYLAAAYLTRVTFTSISRYAPKSFILLGSLTALAGFLLIALSQRPSFWSDELTFADDGLTCFIAGSILANSNETVSAMQMFVRDQYLENVKIVASQLKKHFLMTKLARVCSFISVGFLYKLYNVEGVALLGAGLAALQISCLAIFLILDIFRIHYDPNNAFGDEFIDFKPHCRPTCSIRASRGRRRMFKSAMSKLNRTLSKHYPSDLPQSILRFVIPLCVFGRTLSSVCIWGSSALLLFENFTQGFVAIGLIYAGASACDFIVTFVMLTDGWDGKFKKLCPSPRDLFAGMFGITLSSTLVAVPIFPAFVSGFMMYCICNSMLRIILTEMQGSSENATERLTFQVARRLWTAASLYVLPILYNLHPRLPLVLGLWFALISSVVLTIYMSCFQYGEVLDDVNLRRNKGAVTAAKNRPSKRPERNLVFAEQVMLGRLMKGKDV